LFNLSNKNAATMTTFMLQTQAAPVNAAKGNEMRITKGGKKDEAAARKWLRRVLVLFLATASGDSVQNASTFESVAASAAVCDATTTGSSPQSKKYLLYKVQSGEGFNLQRNVFMRVTRMMAQFPDAHNFTIVLPPFANSIHWSDRSTHSFGKFFDLEILRENLNAVELSEFLSAHHSVDTVVHLTTKGNHSAAEVVSRYDEQRECTPESVTSENSGWRNELQIKQDDHDSMAPFEGSMLGYTFRVRNLVCLEVRYDMHGNHLASALAEILSNSSSVLVDNAGKISWNYASGEGEQSPSYYNLLATMRFKKHVHDAALDFMSFHRFSQDFVAVHMRRKDFLDVRPDVPSPAEVGIQLAALIRNLLLDESLTLQSPRIISVYVATDSTDPKKDIVDLRDSLNASLERRNGANVSVEVLSFSGTDHGLEEGEMALIDQIICSSATQFVGSNTSYFTKTVFEERLLLGKSIPSTYAALCKANSNENARCQEDLSECITCMQGYIPRLSEQLVGEVASMASRQTGLFDRYRREAQPLRIAEAADEPETKCALVESSSGICFVIMSQFGSQREEKAGEELHSRIKDAGHASFLLHKDAPADERNRGHWTFLPLLTSFSSGEYGCYHSTSRNDTIPISWYVFLHPDTQPKIDAIRDALAPLDSSQPHFVGHALRDSVTSICHHYSMDFDFTYASLESGFAITDALLRRLNQENLSGARRFHIDPDFELAKQVFDAADTTLTNKPLWTKMPRMSDERKYWQWDGLPAPHSILVGIKTTEANHLTRVPIVKKAWTDGAARSGANVVFYSETRDDSIPTVHDGIINSEKIKGEAKKLQMILKHAADITFGGRQAGKEHPTPSTWLLIADDDTLVNFLELRRVLSDYDGLQPLIIGDRYAYGHGRPGGYDYPTGGAGIVVSHRALEMIVEANNNECTPQDTGTQPDDMWLGRCAQSLGIPLVDEPGFHQARPSDYHPQSISLHRPISFHRFKDIDEALEISRTYLNRSE
jgi:UDP-glucose:O-linked fucose beta-1,3-glucosyltransferase